MFYFFNCMFLIFCHKCEVGQEVTIRKRLNSNCLLSEEEVAWNSGCEMDRHVMTRGSITVGNGVKTELHVLRKDAVDGTLYIHNQLAFSFQ